MDFTAPIRSRSAEEGSVQIPLWGLPLVLVLLYVCLFSGLGAIGLIGPDDPRYAAIARAMAETHDWVTPRLWGSPWFEKPVLYYWAAGIAMRIFGVNEFAARVPSAAAALLAVIATAWTALRSYGLGAAWYSLLMLPASVAMIGFSRAAGPDMLFAGFLTAAMAAGIELLQERRPGNVPRVWFGILLGAAALAKGPAAVVLAGGSTLVWAALTRNWRASIQFFHPWILAAFCATALPWYVLCSLRNPDFLRTFFWHHNFERYVTPVFQHPQPVWFYAGIIALGLIPWTILAAAAPFVKWDRQRWRESPSIFFISWALFPFLFFSFSESKLPGYILPSIPPLFLLMSRAATRLIDSASAPFARVVLFLIGAMILLTTLPSTKTLLGIGRNLNVPSRQVLTLVLLAVIGGLVVIALSLTKERSNVIPVTSFLVAALVLFLNIEILPLADSRLSSRQAARDVLRLNSSGEGIAAYDLPRDWSFGMNYYLGRELPQWAPDAPPPEWLVTTAAYASEFVGRGDRFQVVSEVGSPYAVLIHVLPAHNKLH